MSSCLADRRTQLIVQFLLVTISRETEQALKRKEVETMKYHKLIENAVKPNGFWGKLMIRSMNKGHSALTDWALTHFPIQSGNVVLDVGCGGGKTVNKLCDMVGCGKVYGIDYSELCVRRAEKLNQKNILCNKAIIRQASVSALPFENEKFDAVTAVETYYFWPDKLGDLREIARTLKRGGRLLLVFEMLADPVDPKKWEEVENRLHIEAVTREGMEEMLERAGYLNIRTYVRSGTTWMCAIAEKE